MEIIKFETLKCQIFKLSNNLVILDKNKASFYEIEPRKLKQQLKKNIDKFLENVYQISNKEFKFKVPKNMILLRHSYIGTNLWVYIEKSLDLEEVL